MPCASASIVPFSDVDFLDSFLEQDRRVQEQAPKSTSRTILFRVHQGARHQQGGKVHLVAVHAGKPGTIKRVPAVSLSLLVVLIRRFMVYRSPVCSLTQATDTSNIRLVFAAVKETILQNALKDSGIL